MLATIRRIAFLIATSLFATLAVAQTIYTTHDNNGRSIGTINASTGSGTDIGATGESSYALARDLDGTLYTTYTDGSGNAQLAIVSPTTGAIVSTIGDLGVPLAALEIDGTGQMWGVGYENQSVNDTFLYRINKETAAITPVGDTGVSFTMDLSFDPSGNLYSTVANNLYQLNLSTGASTLVATITGVPSGGKDGGVMGIMHDTDGTLYATEYVVASPLYEINPITGVATVIGNTGFDFPHGGDIYGLPKFTINAGHSGAWYNSDTSGQGQLIDVVPATQFMFLAWFTFTAAASNNPDEQHWYTAQGNYSGDTAELILYETLGGQFDDPQETSTNPVGTVTLSFTDCEQGQMVYSIDTDGREGTIPLQRLIAGSDDVCEEQSGQAAITTEAVDINAGMDGTWVNNDTLGQGFLIDAHPNEQGGNFIFVAWFTYGDDTASGQRWLTAQGDFAGSSTAEIPIYETTGGGFNDPQLVDLDTVGTMTIDFEDCSNAQLSYSLTDDAIEGDVAIIRLIPGGQALCEELAGAD